MTTQTGDPAGVLRLAAFDLAGTGGNPAGVVLDARGLDEPAMLRVAAGAQDFERVIKALRDAAKVLAAYGVNPATVSTLKSDADALRELLVQTIAASHPAWPGDLSDDEYKNCRAFIAPFNTIYSFNYDLLLYWAQMHTDEASSPTSDDGFRKQEDNYDAAYVVWEPSQSHEQNMFFLHGALHVFDTGT